MDSSPTETVFKHLGNIVDLGNICSLKEVFSTKKPIITGRVVQILPFVKKSRYQIKDSLTIILKEVCNLNKHELLQFRAIFIEEAAQLVSNLDINEGDYMAFCNVKLFPVPALKRNPFIYSKQIIVGLERSNDIANVFYKRKNMTRWSSFHNINSELLENRAIDFESVAAEPVPSEQPDSNSTVHSPIPSTSRNDQGFVTSTESGGISPSTSGSSDALLFDHVETIEKANDLQPSETSKPRNVMMNLAKEFEQNSKKNCSDEGRNEKYIDDKYQYLKLAQLKKGAKVNVYGIVRRIVKKPTMLSNNKCHLIINIIDDSGVNEFLVTIFSTSYESFPKISPNCIIRLHRLQVEEFNDALNGKVLHGRDVLVFDGEDTSVTHSIANKFTLTDSDVKRVEELKGWALENMTNFRPFTSLSSLELKQKTINLLGEVSYVKVYEDRPVLVLRIRDGTKCKIQYERLNLDLNVWAKVITGSKSYPDESEDIDIVIDEPDGNFKALKIGDRIELFNVKVIPKTRYIKANAIGYLKFFMKGIWEDLKVVPPKETHSKGFPVQNTFLNKADIPSKPSYTLNIVKKRRLFDPDKSVVFENDDSNRNPDKSTNTDNLKNNHEKHGRKSDTDFEKGSAVNKSPRTKNHDGLDKNKDKENDYEKNKRKSDTNLEKTNAVSLSPQIENHDDMSIHLDKFTSTENNLKNDKRKSDTDLEKISPVIKSPRTEDQVSAASTLEQNAIVESAISRIENNLVLHDSKETENYLLTWPQPPSKDPFNIKVTLICTNPPIDEDCDERDILSIVKTYCTSCDLFFSYGQTKWITVNDEPEPVAFCSKCHALGHYKEVNFVLSLKIYLNDQHGDVTPAVILADFAETFLGCTVFEICASSEARIKVRDRLNSYFSLAGKEKKSFIASITPVVSKDDNKIKYHVTAFR